MSDVIFLKEARFHCHLGVTARERAAPQEVLLDVELGLDLSKASATDHIGDTINYTDVWKRIRECLDASEFHLVEAVASRVADMLLAGFPQAEEVAVRVTKPGALATRDVEAAGVAVRRRRVSGEW